MNDDKLHIFQIYMEKMKNIQLTLYKYLSKDKITDEDYQDLIRYLNDEQVLESKCNLYSFLHLIDQISSNHHRDPLFFDIFDKILINIKDSISRFFTNIEIFYIFRRNKRLLLILFENQILIPDESIYSIITTEKYQSKFYPEYFSSEFKEFNSNQIAITDFEQFNAKRKIGENDRQICELIRKDDIVEFIILINKANLPLKSSIKPSEYETNPFLLKNAPTLIEYAAFFGSIQIFQYLKTNGVELESRLWLYSIHGQNPEIIQILEENKIMPNDDNSYQECLIESIKCHHNDITDYIQNNLIESDIENKSQFIEILKYYNYDLFTAELNDYLNLNDLYSSLNIPLIDLFLNVTKTDINCEFQVNHCTYSCLNYAVEMNNIELIHYALSNQNINVNSRAYIYYFDNLGAEITPLNIAIENDNFQVFKTLLNHPNIDINEVSIYYKVKTKYGITYNKSVEKTPLCLAIEEYNLKIIECLFDHPKLDVNKLVFTKKSDDNETFQAESQKAAFHIAASKSNEKILTFFLHQRKDVDVNIKFYKKIYHLKTFDVGYKESILDEDFNDCYPADEAEYYLNGFYKKEEESDREYEGTAFTKAVSKSNYNIMKVLLSSEKVDINVKIVNKGYTDKLFIKLEEEEEDLNDESKFADENEENDFEDKIKIKIKDKFTLESKKKNKKSKVKNSKVFIKKTKDTYIYENVEKPEYKDIDEGHHYMDKYQGKAILNLHIFFISFFIINFLF